MKTLIFILLNFLALTGIANNSKEPISPDKNGIVISGKVIDKNTGEALIGAAVYIQELKTGAVTDTAGFYTINLKQGSYNIVISYVGYETCKKQLHVQNSTTINYKMTSTSISVQEVVVSGTKKNGNTSNNEMSVVKLKMEQIKSVPALMGEVDLLRVIQLMPGVQNTGEGTSGFSVRGGGAEQNLVILDDAIVYNATHLMGFFSVFNNDAVKDVKLYKGDIPASNGSRLSSLLDVQMKNGNMNKYSVNAGLGTISSRLTIEGPILKNKCSFLVSGRRSYADLFLKLSNDTNLSNNKLYFYDINYRLAYNLNDKNKLFISGYHGNDVYGYTDILATNWGNQTQSIRWNHIYTKKLSSGLSASHSNYNYNLTLSEAIAGYKWDSKINDYSLKADFNYYLNESNKVKFGYMGTYHAFNTGKITQNGNSSLNNYELPNNYALEHGIYISNEQTINKHLSLDYGIRVSLFQNIGPATIYNFDENHNAIDSTVYESGKVFNSYSGIEPRLSAKYELDKKSSIKASYSRTRQYIQLASNSQGGTPMDFWFPSNPNVKPQIADQFAVGYFRNFLNDIVETSVEVYYKDMQNQIDFKDHAILIMNPQIDGELRVGNARSYGIELFVRKQSGRFTGWVSYTLSKSEKQIDGINDGAYYPTNFDKPHNISLVAMYDFTKRLSMSTSWVYYTGAPVNFPTGKYEYGNKMIPVYSGRNGSRLPDYHRFDVSVTLKGKDKPGKKYKGEWNISIYNLYNRKNAYTVTFEQSKENPSVTEAYKVYLFPVLPSLSYNVKF